MIIKLDLFVIANFSITKSTNVGWVWCLNLVILVTQGAEVRKSMI